MQYSSISRMVIAPVMLVVFILVALNTTSIIKTFSVLSGFEELESTSIQAERDVNVILSNFKTQVQEWKNVLLRGKNDEDRVKYWQRFQDKEAEIQSALVSMKGSNALSDDSKTTIDEFLSAHKYMATKYREGYQAFLNSNYDPTVGDSYVRGIDREPAKLLSSLSEQIAGNARAQVGNMSAGMQTTMSLILILSILLSGASILYVVIRLRKQIINPVKNIAKCIDKLEKSDYSYDLDYYSKHELGTLANAARSLQQKLNQSVTLLLESEQEVQRASEHLSHTTTQIKAGAQKQSDASNTLKSNTSTLHEISESLSTIAGQVSVATRESEVKVSDCNRIFAKANDGFQQLAESVLEASKIVDVLQTRSKTIHNVVNVINEIADQTNLLALNAAIEAARAGEHGRGFAVVADEVRALAAKTQQSTKEINQILNAFEGEANSAVDAMSKGKTLSDSNAEQAELALQRLQSLVKDVQETANVVVLLNNATHEQNEVLQDVERVTQSVLQLAADYESMASNTSISQAIKKATSQVDKVVQSLSK